MSTAVAEPEAPEVEQTAPVETPPAPPADCPAHVREHYDAIREKEQEVRRLEGIFLSLASEAKEAKKDFEAADKALRNLIADGADPQLKLPLVDAEPRKPKRVRIIKEVRPDIPGETWLLAVGDEYDCECNQHGAVAVHAGDRPDSLIGVKPDEFEVIEWTCPTTATAADNDTWRKAPFAELGLTEKQNELFAAAGIETIGALEDMRAQIAEGRAAAQWPKGIGPAKVTDIENRVIDWLDRNRDKFGEVAAEANTTVWKDGKRVGEMSSEEAVNFIIDDARKEFAKSNGKAKAKKRK